MLGTREQKLREMRLRLASNARISYDCSNDTKDKELKRLNSTLKSKKLSYMQKFSMKAHIKSQATLMTLFKEFKMLSNISLSFYLGLMEPEKGLKNKHLLFRDLPFLTELQLNFPAVMLKGRYEDDQDLLWGLRFLRLLTKLNLTFTSWKQTQKNLVKTLFGSLRKLKSLSELGLSFFLTKENHKQEIECLAHELKDLNYLTVLYLEFKSCNVFDEENLECLSQTLRNFKKLSSLAISYKGCRKISSTAIIHILPALEEMKNLSELKLVFADASDDFDKEPKEISFQNKFNSLSKLKSLNLHLSYSLFITDEVLKSLASNVQCLPSLTDLSLAFESCPKITNQGLFDICEGLKNISLLSLDLNFMGSSQITSEGFFILMETIKKLKSLSKLHFHFNTENELSDNCMEKLSVILMSLPDLSNFSLRVNCSNKISNEGIKELCEGLKHLKHLAILNLNFDYSSLISIQGIKCISALLPQLFSLQKMNLSCFSAGKVDRKIAYEEIIPVLEKLKIKYEISF